MVSTHFREKALVLARQLYPELDGESLIAEAERIFAYLSANNYQNFVGLNLIAEDVVGFAEMLSLDHNSQGKQVPLVLRDYQRDLLSSWQDESDQIILHAKNMGISLLLCVYALWISCFKPKTNLGYVVLGSNPMEIINRQIRVLHGTCSVALPRVYNWTRSSIQFENGSKILFLKPNTYLLGHSLTHVLSDDTGHISFADDENFYSTIMFANTGQLIAAGVPGPNMGIFHDLATTHVVNAAVKKVPYSLHPDYTPAIEKKIRADIGHSAYENQYNCQFKDYRS